MAPNRYAASGRRVKAAPARAARMRPCRSSRSRGSRAAGRARRRASWPSALGPDTRAHPGAGRHRARPRASARSCSTTATRRWRPRPRSCSTSPTARSTWPRSSAPRSHAGRTVVSDRYVDSSLAYQGYGRGLDLDAASAPSPAWPPAACGPTSRPPRRARRTSASPASARAASHDRLEAEVREFHERVRAGLSSRWRRRSPRAGCAWTARGAPDDGRRSAWPRRRRRAACWRAWRFADVLGHDRVKGLLARALRAGPPAARAPAQRPGGSGEADARPRGRARRSSATRAPGERLRTRCRTCDRTRARTPSRPDRWWSRRRRFGTIKIEHVRDARARDRAACPSRRGRARS